jgi:hypothetical protein
MRWGVMMAMAALFALHGAGVAAEEKAPPASLVGWWAYHQASKWTPCQRVDARRAAQLKQLRCAWETPIATPAFVCHEKGDDAWVAFEKRSVCRGQWAEMQED